MKNKLLFLILATILGNQHYKTHAQGDLLITPNRVVFEGRKIKEILNLLNTGSKTTTFSVSFVQRRMNEDGSFSVITEPDPGQMFADPYLRIYPRKVTLLPGEAQVVMLQRRMRTDMESGEYRSHLYFRSEKDYSALGDEKQDTIKAFSVKLVPIFGISIPIIIRTGDLSNTTTITDLKIIREEENVLNFTVVRNGNISVYGDFTVEYLPKKGESYLIGVKKGVAVYTNINKRYVTIKLNKSSDINLKQGILKVKYISRENAEEPQVFAAKELDLGI
ncbi:hypothetical protein PI23P_08465 [Polaribacter irgensii 23-P]|uniref:Pili assembly chaperone N-terminal domain-containing protein n=1 Tax=Polaribacter irgensii 23-P TaxID=313594 RepID=A4BZQ2_9FLAO|nr:hypothetical protein [Polaribacter irgensii]EAR12645.1 hypothetical protein PI23P_08465 [Polaribacter irgensii 23-P]